MFGQLIVCKERCDRNCGMAEEGSSGQVGEGERHRQVRSSGQSFGEGDVQRSSYPPSEGVAGEVVTGGCA